MSEVFDFIVVGGGLVGACLAEELRTGGATVLVLDAGPEPGQATRQAAGVAAPPLRYADDRELFDWMLAAEAALRSDAERLTRSGSEPFTVARPLLRLLRPQDTGAFQALVERGLPLGTVLTPEESAERWPRLRLDDGRCVARAEAVMVDGAAYLSAVRAAALASGARWWQDARVTSVQETTDRVLLECADGRGAVGDRVVLAVGAWTGELSEGRLPVTPQRGQLALLSASEPLADIVSSRFYLAPLPSGHIVAGATEENAGFDMACTASGIAQVLAFAVRTVPGLAGAALVETRAGLRPVSDTGRPLVGRIPGRSRMYAATGHAGYGLLSARHTAHGMAAGLLHKDWERLPYDFCPTEKD